MSILAAFALALALACTPTPTEARPLSLVDGEHAVELSTGHAATVRSLLMRALLLLPLATS